MPQIPAPTEIVFELARVIFAFFAEYWWLVLPPAFFFIFLDVWLLAIQTRWVRRLPWITLEVRTPKNIERTARAMEQIFAGMHALYDPPNPLETWWEGRLQEWVSFEMVGDGEGIHFYVRTIKKFRNLVESAIYAQYPQAEIVEVEDYTEKFPANIPNKEYDLWGTEMIFLKPDPYPIRTYVDFEEKGQEESRVDTLAAMAEVMGRLKPGEAIWTQYLIKPADPEWIKKGEELVAQIVEKKEKPKSQGLGAGFAEFLANLLKAPMEHPLWSEEKKEEGFELRLLLSPIEKNAAEAIDRKISKLGFETVIRWIYVGRTDIFSRQYIGAILSYFRQFNSMTLNGLRLNKFVAPKIRYRWYFKARREFIRKRALLGWYKSRTMIDNSRKQKKLLVNVEELASLYHYPTLLVEAPGIASTEYKKGGPPSSLPMEEGEI
ncbi:MAG: hypothetical protein HYS57_01120 [Parcubacteria group bacterium]|nr:hypothetical protein [Parcubacteria group bacterium]